MLLFSTLTLVLLLFILSYCYIFGLAFIDILIFLRCLIISLIILPLSFIYTLYLKARNFINFTFASHLKQSHDTKIDTIIHQIKRHCQFDNMVPMCTGRPGWENMSPHNALYKKKYFKIKLNNLHEIIELNTEQKYIIVEPMVTMAQISSLLLPLGWTLPVLPELDDLTIGGLINGCGIETSSHIYGLFQYTCLEFEIITATGELVICSKNQNSDLFYNIPWSYGTLGFLVSAKIQIIPAKPYVLLEYFPLNKSHLQDISDYFAAQCMDNSYQFVEGLLYSAGDCVVMKGKMVDLPDQVEDFIPINNVTAFHAPWFYVYVQKFINQGNILHDGACIHREYIPLKQYYHRHTKSLFWEIEHLLPFGNHPFFRYLFGWMLPIKVSFLKLTQTESIKRVYEKLHVAQDVLVDVSKLAETLEFCDKEFQLYPIWLCPMKLFNQNGHGIVQPPPEYCCYNAIENFKLNETDLKLTKETSLDCPPNLDWAMYVDVGIYGMPKSQLFKPRESIHALEKFLIENKGYEMFYGDVFLSRPEFDRMMHLDEYDKLRKLYSYLAVNKKDILSEKNETKNKKNGISVASEHDNSLNSNNDEGAWLLPHIYDKINRQARG